MVLANTSLQDKWNRLYARHQRGLLSTDEKLNMLLQTGVDAFGMEIGLISHIQGNSYTVLYSTIAKSVCMQYSLSKTFCELSFRTKDIVAIHEASSGFSQHPAKTRFGVEAYLGIPLRIDGRIYGTMAFIKGESKTPFSEGEKSLLRQLGRKTETILAGELARI
jgi:GAF domain-containing protein